MKAPLFFIPLTLLFWGGQMGTLWIALALAAALLAFSLSGKKYSFEPEDFNKFVDVSTILVAAMIVLGFTLEAKTAIWFFLKWLPAALFPVIAVQQFSVNGRFYAQSFFITTRNKSLQKGFAQKQIDISYPYAFVCVLCAGMSPTPVSAGSISDNGFYFAGSAFFCAWALWGVRSSRFPRWVWVLMISLILVMGFWGQKTLRLAGYKARDWVISRYVSMYGGNPFKNFTAMGDIGKLKLSASIVMRLAPLKAPNIHSHLLQTAVYNRFGRNTWISRSPFRPLTHNDMDDSWLLNPTEQPAEKMKIYARPAHSRVVLSLPAGTTRIFNLKSAVCSKNALQVVRVEDAPSLIAATIEYTGRPSWDGPFSRMDISIPSREQAVIEKIIKEMGLAGLSQEQIAEQIKTFFLNGFEYSLQLPGKGNYDTPLQNFLVEARKGHCEFFATATVLLMRAAGIPARYVTGFMVSEYSSFEKRYIVRKKDAHAWARIFINGQWMDYDTTPPGFAALDDQQVPDSRISDWISYLSFLILKTRHETGKAFLEAYGLWLILPLGLILWFRLRQSSRIKKVLPPDAGGKKKIKDTLQQSFYLLESYLSKKGLGRHPHETYPVWLDRIRDDNLNQKIADELSELLHLHNKMIFGRGLDSTQKKHLFNRIRQIIASEILVRQDLNSRL